MAALHVLPVCLCRRSEFTLSALYVDRRKRPLTDIQNLLRLLHCRHSHRVLLGHSYQERVPGSYHGFSITSEVQANSSDRASNALHEILSILVPELITDLALMTNHTKSVGFMVHFRA